MGSDFSNKPFQTLVQQMDVWSRDRSTPIPHDDKKIN
jgi:hypothetical protein